MSNPSWVWCETHSFLLTKARFSRAWSSRFQIFFAHHLWDFPCFSLAKKFTHNDFCIPVGHGLSCSPHFRRHATESITPTPRHTSCLHLTPHGCQIPTISRPNTAISSLLSTLMPLHHNRFTLVHLPSPILAGCNSRHDRLNCTLSCDALK